MADIIRRETTHKECGNDLTKALDPKQPWIVDDEQVCYACASRDMVMREREKKHEKDKDQPGKFSWRDGRIVVVRPATAKDQRPAAQRRTPVR